MPASSPFGVHRAVEPPGSLPYAARRLDPALPIRPDEVLVAVERLNLDSASFRQLRQQAADDPKRLARLVGEIVADRGKMHNPVTGSGGVLIGKVTEVGAERNDLQPGERVVSLVSLTTTPLHLDHIGSVHFDSHQIEAQGHAILFGKSIYGKLPDDLPEGIVLSVLDVCGAPAQTARLARQDDRVLIVGGGGRSGLLCTVVALDQVGERGQVLALVAAGDDVARRRLAAVADPRLQVLTADATDALAVRRAVAAATQDCMADLTLNCVNVPHSEMSCILATRSRGLIYFFNMATSFAAAALGAESVGLDVDMMIGNGYAAGHADFALDVVRRHPELQDLLS